MTSPRNHHFVQYWFSPLPSYDLDGPNLQRSEGEGHDTCEGVVFPGLSCNNQRETTRTIVEQWGTVDVSLKYSSVDVSIDFPLSVIVEL